MKKIHMDPKYFEVLDSANDEKNYFTDVILKLKSVINLDDAMLLDVGCGTGKFIAPILKFSTPKIIGVDGKTGVADRAIARGYKDVKVVDDLSNIVLPFDDESFDCVISKDVFEHLYDPLFTLDEIYRVMRMGGIFLFHVPNHFPLIGRYRFLLNNQLDTFSYFQDESRWEFPHIRFYEYFDNISIFNNAGFEIIEDLSHLFPAIPILHRFKMFNSLSRWMINQFPNQFSEAYTLLLKKVSK